MEIFTALLKKLIQLCRITSYKPRQQIPGIQARGIESSSKQNDLEEEYWIDVCWKYWK